MRHLSIRQDQSVSTRPFKRAAASAVVTLTLLALVACAPEPVQAGPAPAVSASESRTPTEAPDPLEGLVSGDVIPAEVAAELNASWGKQSDHRGYPMPSGEWVLLKGLEPLPANVHQAVHDAAVGSIQWPLFRSSNEEQTRAVHDIFHAAVVQQELLTGRKITYVLHAMSFDQSSMRDVPRWVAGAQIGRQYNGTSREEAIAHAQKWVDDSPGARVMLVIDALA